MIKKTYKNNIKIKLCFDEDGMTSEMSGINVNSQSPSLEKFKRYCVIGKRTKELLRIIKNKPYKKNKPIPNRLIGFILEMNQINKPITTKSENEIVISTKSETFG
ncbi:hypothetical protein HC766_05705 [Candidatus Gracilibacteria bacterium]|nr:hypothetical protein [Candidatus Gracilibacteria bacterium]